MYVFSSLLPISLLAALVRAGLPELHELGRRDNVCALDLRGATAKDCLVDNKGIFFTLTPPSTITTTTVSTLPANSQCDHIVELRLLDGALQKSGVCEMITKTIKAKSSVSKAILLQPLSDVINGHDNLNFLASAVNNRKKTVVGKSLRGTPRGNDDLDKAVGNYFQQTKAASTAIAQSLDSKVAAIIAQAQAIANALPPDSRMGRNKTTTKADLHTAVATENQSKSPVSTAWPAVLIAAPHT